MPHSRWVNATAFRAIDRARQGAWTHVHSHRSQLPPIRISSGTAPAIHLSTTLLILSSGHPPTTHRLRPLHPLSARRLRHRQRLQLLPQRWQMPHHRLVTILQQPRPTALDVVLLALERAATPRARPKRPLKPRRPEPAKLPVHDGRDLERRRVPEHVVLA